MSELQYRSQLRPAVESIYTKGNKFWRGDERFLVKGINYDLRQPRESGENAAARTAEGDPLRNDHVEQLRRAIVLLRELDLNTILVSHLDAGEDHHDAFTLLAEAGFYVLVTISVDDCTGDTAAAAVAPSWQPRPMQPYYKAETLVQTFRLLDQLADYPNVLGFVVSGDRSLSTPATSKMAEVLRASVRDIKTFLQRRRGRRVPVGVSQPSNATLQLLALQYFTAGSPADESRIDFWTLQCYSWANKSSFQISGWKNMVAKFDRFPVPMIMSEYGAYTGRPRVWQEVECLYSPEMTGVFSGGCLYTFYESQKGYGIVEVDENGQLQKKREFERLRKRFQKVSDMVLEETCAADGGAVDYATWAGGYPETRNNGWLATDELPDFPLDWDQVMHDIAPEDDWELVEGETELSVPNGLASLRVSE